MSNIRCKNCSLYPNAECFDAHSAFLRRASANKIEWISLEEKGLIIYFCSKKCELNHKVKNKTHLKLVSVNKLTIVK